MILTLRVAAAVSLLALPALPQDWTNYGGNSARNGRSAVPGPTDADLLWSETTDFSIISWHPFIEDGRVFTVRQSNFPLNGGVANDQLLAYDLDTGSELWSFSMPWGGDTSLEWIAWIGGVNGGQLYASRSSNLQPTPIKAYDAATGAFLWDSAVSTEAWAHDGIVFAPNGDPIVGDRLTVTRIDRTDGSTVWSTARSCPVSGNCGAAATDTAVYIDEAAPGGNQLTKMDIVTGAVLYSSPVMAGFTDQNTPFLSEDGQTVYFSRTQNNTSVDFLFAFQDTGAGFVEKWNRPVRWTTSHEHGLAADGSIYTFTQANEFVRLDPDTGAITGNAGVLSILGTGNLSPKTAVDAAGNVYVSNGWASNPATNGRVWCFNEDLSSTLFTLNLNRQNSGGPVLGDDGTLVVCDRFGVYAYRSPVVDTYCTAGTTTNGCTAQMDSVGTPSASAATAFDLLVTGVEGQKSGIIFYGVSGPSASGWGPSSSILCVKPPTQRTPGQSSGGTSGACDGLFTLDWNAYVAANPTALGAPFGPGDSVWVQGWFRDPPSPKTTSLSNGLTFTLLP